MPRGVRKQIVYTGRAGVIYAKIQKLEQDLKTAKAELKVVYKEQLKEEKLAIKAAQENKKKELLDLIEKSGKPIDEIIEILNNNQAK